MARASLKKDAGGRLHIAAGNAGGGQFANLHTRVTPLLKAWLDAGADPAESPLNGWSTTQLRKLAQQRGMGVEFPPRTRAVVMHSAILADVKQRGADPVGAITARKTVAAKAAVAAAPKKAPAKKARQSLPDGPIAPDIPADVAYKRGRRIYVKTGYRSRLNDELRALGAKWDPQEKALYVGTVKLDKVLPVVQARHTYRRETAEVLASGRWVSIPFTADSIRQQAKDLGARWDRDRKQWAFPSDESRDRIQRLVDDWTRAREERKAKERAQAVELAEAERKTRAEQARHARAEQDRRVIEQAGRVPTGDPVRVTSHSGRRMKRAEADRVKPQPGEVIDLGGGRRGLVLESTAAFVSEDMAEDGIIGNPADGAGWYFDVRAVPVRPTSDELEADRRAELRRKDAADARRIMLDASKLGNMQHDVPLRRIEGKKILEHGVGSDLRTYGEITLTPNGEVWYQHPGFYDTYITTQGRITDPATIARVEEIVAGGSRTLPGRYEVRA